MKVVLPVVPIGFVRDGSLPLLWILLPRLYIFRLCANCSKLFGERVNDIVSCMNSPVDNDDFLFVWYGHLCHVDHWYVGLLNFSALSVVYCAVEVSLLLHMTLTSFILLCTLKKFAWKFFQIFLISVFLSHFSHSLVRTTVKKITMYTVYIILASFMDKFTSYMNSWNWCLWLSGS